MEKIFEISSNISTPLALAGFISSILFFILKQIIAKKIYPELTKKDSSKIIVIIINKVFILSLVATILGFLGFIVNASIQNETEPKEPEVVRKITLHEFLNERNDIEGTKQGSTKENPLERKLEVNNHSTTLESDSQHISKSKEQPPIRDSVSKDDSTPNTSDIIDSSIKTINAEPKKDTIQKELVTSSAVTNDEQDKELGNTQSGNLSILEFENGIYYAGFSLERFSFHRSMQTVPLWGWASGIKTILSYQGHSVEESVLAYGRPEFNSHHIPSISRFNGEYEDFYLILNKVTYKSITQLLDFIDRDEPFLFIISDRAYPFIGVLFQEEEGEYKINEIRLLNCFEPGGSPRMTISSSELQSLSIEIIEVNYKKK